MVVASQPASRLAVVVVADVTSTSFRQLNFLLMKKTYGKGFYIKCVEREEAFKALEEGEVSNGGAK